MLEQTDRVALAVPNADEAATGLNAIFDSVIVDDTVDTDANARRITLQWGYDQLELYEPKGPGPVADFIKGGKRGAIRRWFRTRRPRCGCCPDRAGRYQDNSTGRPVCRLSTGTTEYRGDPESGR